MKLLNITKNKAPKHTNRDLTGALQGHRSVTIVITALVLMLAVCVFFVNNVVIMQGKDDVYRADAEKNASLTNFDTSSLQKVQEFSAAADNATLPAGRVNPFASN